MKRRTHVCAVSVVTLMVLLTMSSGSVGVLAGTQEAGGSAGPSFPCDKATTEVEKLICSDRELSSLDLEYSHLYNDGLKGKEKREVDNSSYNEAIYLKQRESCAEGIPAADQLRPEVIGCIGFWYYQRIATLSDLSSMSATEWSPRLVAGSDIYSRDSSGAERIRIAKIEREIYFKTPGIDRFFKLTEERGQPLWPARMDSSITFDVYKNVLGNLTLVEEYHDDGNPRMTYFFNGDGRLAAQSRRFSSRSVDHIYDQYDLIFYNGQGLVAQTVQLAHMDRKVSPVRKDPAGPWGTRPAFASFAALFDSKFKTAGILDVDQLGLCYLDLADGYPTVIRVLNVPPQPLDVFRQSLLPMNYRNFDGKGTKRTTGNGDAQDLGTLDGKRVYSIRYEGDLHAILVERQSGRFLPVMYFSPFTSIDRLEIVTAGDRQILAYSSRISGTGGFTDDWYFILDHGIPKSVDYRTVLADELKKIVPEHFGTRRGGYFDLAKLTFTTAVWRDEDANDSPTGGSIQVVLGIQDGHFVVKSSHWERSN